MSSSVGCKKTYRLQIGKALSEGLNTGEHTITFTEKDYLEKLKDFSEFIPREFATFSSVAATSWALAEVFIAVLENRPSFVSLVIPVAAIATFVTLYKAYFRYTSYVPDTLVSESTAAQLIYRQQRFGWQWALAKEILENRIQSSNSELKRIRSGAEFVEPRRLAHSEYYAWVRNRPEAIVRLLTAVTIQCTGDLPAAIGSTKHEADLMKLKLEIEALANLYRTATRFELDCHAIVAPEAFEELHEMSHGWTDTIREGVNQFMEIVSKLAELDKRKIKEGMVLPEFEIKFDSPENIEEFNVRLRRIDPSVLEID